MMMANGTHMLKQRLARAGLRLLFLLLILTLAACYPTTYRETPKLISTYTTNDIFDKIDNDGNKKINRQEHTYAASKSFDKLDKDKDGYLDRNEFKATGILNFNKHFDKLDTNQDGRISKDEFIKGAEKHFTIVDKNNDSVIDKNELNLYWEEENIHLDDTPPLIKPFIIFYF